MFERSTETGSVWVTLKRSSLKSKAIRNKMATAGEVIEYRCRIHATNGKKTLSTLKYKILLWTLLVMEKLVDIVHFLHLEIHEAFGSASAFRNYK
ncbi:signal recognition particle 14 kDa protein-like isoform X2 [Arachis duranensis]|uniref:Signal recognition particle 14 kDa protein n=1 Tax=Arachis duranensis TaxID=130453 RepID=A0A9C6TVM4_ARADU|nr:signal recognition particle 14 kDa protein-like isoform X2 [Arachis duranensis]